jgi:hypothetical protein
MKEQCLTAFLTFSSSMVLEWLRLRWSIKKLRILDTEFDPHLSQSKERLFSLSVLNRQDCSDSSEKKVVANKKKKKQRICLAKKVNVNVNDCLHLKRNIVNKC